MNYYSTTTLPCFKKISIAQEQVYSLNIRNEVNPYRESKLTNLTIVDVHSSYNYNHISPGSKEADSGANSAPERPLPT